MIIGIDANEANVQRKVGISEYAYRLLCEFYNLRSKDANFEIYIKDKPKSDFPKEDKNWHYNVFGPKKFWTQFALPLNLFFKSPRPTLFFTTSHYAPRFSPVPTVISVMDISYIHYPEMFKASDLYQLRNWTAYSVRNAKKIITISQSSKDDIIKYYKVSPDKAEVVYPGIKMNDDIKDHKIKEKYNISGDYILFVGTLQPRKNIERLIEAFSKLSSNETKDDNLSLVIVGKKGWMYEGILESPKKYGVENKVRFLDFVVDKDISSLYKNALCFVMPSLYEGFGLTILEAMSYGCPVITSNISSLPEAGGNAAEYVDPYNVDDIKGKIEKVITDKSLRGKMIKKGYEQVKKFSWEKSARKVLDILEEAGSK